MNNIVWYYRWLDPETKTVISGGKLVHKRDYYSSVKDIKLNKDWAAVLTEGSCYLHPIEEMSQDHDRHILYKFTVIIVYIESFPVRMTNRLLALHLRISF